MKKNLGSLTALFLLLFVNTLNASSYEWRVGSNKNEAYVNEAIYLQYACVYSDQAGLYVIEFNPTVDNENYRIDILREDEKIVDGKKINEYEFVLRVKKAGEFSLSLDTLMKKTNKDSIENSVLGRDNANYEEFSLYPLKQKELRINVLPAKSKIIGEFVLNVTQSKSVVDAYEPFHLTLEVDGVGDFGVFEDIKYEIEGVKVFSEPAIKALTLTKDGEKGSWKKKFAFVSDKDFVVEAFNLEYFDLISKEVKTLQQKRIEVKVREATFTKEELLDEKENEFEFSYEYIYYVLTFLAGFLVAKIKFRQTPQEISKDKEFCQKVKKARSLEELAVLLALKNAREHKELISEIESKELTSLSRAKKLICH